MSEGIEGSVMVQGASGWPPSSTVETMAGAVRKPVGG